MPSLPRKVLAVLAVLLAACASPVPRPETVHRGDYGAVRAYIAALARQEMRNADVTGLSVALVDDQNLVWADGFGFADRARDVPAGADTVYRVGSITKLFTAAAVMQLAEQGKLAIDRPIEAVIPGFSMKSRFENARPVTPRLLMSHHAGLPTDILKGFSEPHPRSLAELTRQLQDEYLAFPPGTLWSYSNVGYSLLGIVNVDLGMEIGLSRARIAGREVLIAQTGAQQLLVGERIEPVTIPNAWLERVGEYEITNPGDDRPLVTRIALSRDARHLFLKVSMTEAPDVDFALPLEALDDRVAVIRGLGRSQGSSIVALETLAGAQLMYSGYLLRKKLLPETR